MWNLVCVYIITLNNIVHNLIYFFYFFNIIILCFISFFRHFRPTDAPRTQILLSRWWVLKFYFIIFHTQTYTYHTSITSHNNTWRRMYTVQCCLVPSFLFFHFAKHNYVCVLVSAVTLAFLLPLRSKNIDDIFTAIRPHLRIYCF